MIQLYVTASALRSTDHSLLAVLKTRGDRAFVVVAPKLWNELPLHIRQAKSLSAFKSSLRTHYCSLAFNSLTCFWFHCSHFTIIVTFVSQLWLHLGSNPPGCDRPTWVNDSSLALSQRCCQLQWSFLKRPNLTILIMLLVIIMTNPRYSLGQ